MRKKTRRDEMQRRAIESAPVDQKRRGGLSKYFYTSWPVWLLVCLPVVFLGDVFFAGKTIYLRDFFGLDIGARMWLAENLRHGEFPFWFPYGQCGVPFAAQAQLGSFYPPNWIFIFGGVEAMARIYWAFHLAVAAISFYLLAREWRLGVPSSLLAAITFAFSGYVVTWMEFAHGFCAMVWQPLTLLFITRIVRRAVVFRGAGLLELAANNAGALIGFAVSVALQILASGEFFFYGMLLAAAYTAFLWIVGRRWISVWKSAALLAGAGLVALALAMPQLALTYELVHNSDRATGEVGSMSEVCSSHPKHWLTFLLPFAYGGPGYPTALISFPGTEPVYWAPRIYEFALGGCYVGVVPVLLLPFALAGLREARGSRKRLVIFFGLLGLFGLLMAAGKFTPLYGFLHHYLPGFGRLRFPTKFFLFVTCGMAMLAAVGLQTLNRPKQTISPWMKTAWVVGVVLVALVWGTFLFGMSPVPAGQSDAVTADHVMALVFCTAALALIGALFYNRAAPKWLPAVLVVFAFANLLLVCRKMQPTVKAGIYETKPSIIRHVPTNQSLRVWTSYIPAEQFFYGERREPMISWSRDVGASSSDWCLYGIGNVMPRWMNTGRYMRFLGELGRAPTEQQQAKFLDLLCVRHVVAGPSVHAVLWQGAPAEFAVNERNAALPRAFLVYDWRAARSDDEALGMLSEPSLDFSKTAIVETESPLPPATAKATRSGVVTAFRDGREKVDAEISCDATNLLVLLDSWYPGWKVRVDGVEQPLRRVNYLFRGVFVSPGSHSIEFTYRPTGLTFALASLAAGLVACIGLASLAIARRRQRSRVATAKSDVPL